MSYQSKRQEIEVAMTYEKALKALADDAAHAHARWKRSTQYELSGARSDSQLFVYAHAAKRALIVAISGEYEEGVDPGAANVARAEEMMRQSRHWIDA